MEEIIVPKKVEQINDHLGLFIDTISEGGTCNK